MKLKEIIIADYDRVLSYIVILRICSYLYKNKRKILIQLFKLRIRRLHVKFGIEISYKTEIEKGLRISYGYGVEIHPNAKIGENFTIMK